MKVTFKILFIIFLSFTAQAIEINEDSSDVELLSHSYVYVDSTNRLTKKEVSQQKFNKNEKEILEFGIAPETAVWVKFTLKNSTDKALIKIIEYANSETEVIDFFDANRTIRDGMFHHRDNRTSLNPIFTIRLNPYEERTFYLKTSCKISTFVVKLKLWNELDFHRECNKHKTYIFIFFTIITTLLLYNAMLLLFTKEKVYFYYIFYLASILCFESVYLGVAQLYFFSNEVSEFVTKATIGYIVLLVTPMILFTMEFLHTSRFKRVHGFLRLYLYGLPLIVLLSFDNFLFDLNIMLIFFPLAFVMIFSGFYAFGHGTKEAFIYIIGWSFVIISLTLSVLQSLGGYNVFEDFRYINEVAFSLEAFTFSIALAYRIKRVDAEKSSLHQRLIELQKGEQSKLETLVNQKTKDLQDSLQEKEILYKELNHRVKNNLGMILSLLQLQINEAKTGDTKEQLSIAKDRINSISKLYELLYLKNDNTLFSSETYFRKIVQNIESNFSLNVKILYDIRYNVSVKNSIYLGLILNELVTNSFKYAFTRSGTIKITTYEVEDCACMCVEDDGIGFTKDTKNSLGLTIVETLTKKQLNAQLEIESHKGTKVIILWRDIHAKS